MAKKTIIFLNGNFMKNITELLEIWESFHNSDFKPIEFEGIRNGAGSNKISN